jgi:DNA-binding FadR family transcriptional regulator
MEPAATRLYETVSTDISGRIKTGEFPIGSRLPSERDLAQALNVSRPTIREAIFALELDGYVEVRKGSGVYVTRNSPKGTASVIADVGPFELLEARRSFEAEAAALAALRASPAQIEEMDVLVRRIRDTLVAGDLAESERADQDFHLKLAESTGNSAIYDVVASLWEARHRSPQYRLLTEKAHEAGIDPDSDEHAVILQAVNARDSEGARKAMRDHLNRVFDDLLNATEVHELELTRSKINATRSKFAVR